MASTESAAAGAADRPVPALRALTPADLPALMKLSRAAHWNQNEADWRCMLALGQGFGIEMSTAAGPPTLAASTVLLPYGSQFAWVSMVLVSPEHRRAGLASRLLRHALAALKEQGRFAVLDATPDGRAVYLREGFGDSWGFTRMSRPHPSAGASADGARPPLASMLTRPLQARDWPAIERLDAPTFGASRLPLLKALSQRLPQAARVAEQGGKLLGYVLGREGREACQIGPLLAPDDEVAWALLADALQAARGPVYVDLIDSRPALKRRLLAADFAEQRAFTRMVHGPQATPGQTGPLVLVAGPELG